MDRNTIGVTFAFQTDEPGFTYVEWDMVATLMEYMKISREAAIRAVKVAMTVASLENVASSVEYTGRRFHDRLDCEKADRHHLQHELKDGEQCEKCGIGCGQVILG